MAAILSFVPRTAARKPAQALPPDAGAIIIFPGVRYEREPQAKPGAAGEPAKRDGPAATH